ncbi:MAG: hypothetical protein WCO44_10485 [Bacteroidota bacterium]
MKKLSLINLHKVELKKNMLAQIKGGIDVKCFCSLSNPLLTTKQSGGPIGDLCVCSNTEAASAGVQTKTSL